jgi:hypothetical protein
MDATRSRRTRDRVRQRWYARQRQRRFARLLGFVPGAAGEDLVGEVRKEIVRVATSGWRAANHARNIAIDALT